MDIFEQADVFTPSRAVLQEEEEAAVPSASGYFRPAVCVWNKGLLRKLYPGGLSCDVLVVATCPTSCALLQSIPGKQLIGSVLAPGITLAGTSLAAVTTDGPACSPGQPVPSDRLCCVYSLHSSQSDAAGATRAEAGSAAGAGSGSGGGGVLLVCCQYDVARERAAVWARSVLGQVEFRHAVFVGTIPAEQFRGQGDASQEELLFSLRTRAAQQQAGKLAAALLPTGTVVGGLPAALLSHCQVRGQSAELLLMVEMVAESRWALMGPLAAALGSALGSRGAAEAARDLEDGGVAAAARRALGLGAAALEVYA